MNKFFVTFVALLSLAAAKPGFVEQQHHVIQPVVTKVGAVVHTAPSAVSHQSISQVHDNNAHIVTPVVHAVPVVKTVASPVVHTYAAPAVVKTIPVVKTFASPIVHSTVSHQSHSQIHHHKTIVTPVVAPVVKSYIATAPVVSTVHVKSAVVAAPVAHFVHH